MGSDTPIEASATSSSHIGDILEQQYDKITGPLSTEGGGVATTSEIAHELSELDREDLQRSYSDLTGKTGVTGVTRQRSRSVGSISSELSSPPPTTC